VSRPAWPDRIPWRNVPRKSRFQLTTGEVVSCWRAHVDAARCVAPGQSSDCVLGKALVRGRRESRFPVLTGPCSAVSERSCTLKRARPVLIRSRSARKRAVLIEYHSRLSLLAHPRPRARLLNLHHATRPWISVSRGASSFQRYARTAIPPRAHPRRSRCPHPLQPQPCVRRVEPSLKMR